MKICYLNFDGRPTLEAVDSRTGGLNITLFNLAKTMASLPSTRITIIWRADGKKCKSLSELRNIGIELVKIKAGPKKQLSKEKLEKFLPEFTAKVGSYLTTHRFDIAHTSGSEAGLIMSILRDKKICNSLIWFHKNFATLAVRRAIIEGIAVKEVIGDKISRREKLVLEKCDHIIASTPIEKEEIKRVFGIESDKISVISPGLDHHTFRPPESQYERGPVAISAGRMSKIKDFPFLLKAFKKVVETSRNIKSLLLIIVGGNKKERDRLGLEEMLRELDIEEFVSFVDGVPQKVLAKYFQISKVFVGTSKHETFGRVLVEARACGTPFVVRANSGYSATAKDGRGGYFIYNNSEEAIAERITEILRLPFEEWQKLSRVTLRSTERFSWKKSMVEHRQLYQSFIDKKTVNIPLDD